jgi:glycosyltransferase involved in cell wall biosynthesis
MILHYAASQYRSHWRAAGAYCTLLCDKYHFTPTIADADIVILHYEPHVYDLIYQRYPALKHKYVIGCCVWEATALPEEYQRGISNVQEIWTCSQYSFSVFAKHHGNVWCMPYVVERDMTSTVSDHHFIKNAIHYETGCTYYLTIARLWDKRKNVEALVEAFKTVRSLVPHARLVIKAVPNDPQPLPCDGVTYLLREFTERQINALYDVCDIYVSAHHAEGWGLTLSDAMLARKPVVATGYSGNLEFMSPYNSLLVTAEEDYIKPSECVHLFTSNMKWGYPDRRDLVTKLLLAYEQLASGRITSTLDVASKDIAKFKGSSVNCLLQKRLDAIELVM